MVLHCWLQRAGCISQVTELIYKFMAKLYSSDFPLCTITYMPGLSKYFHQLYDALMLMANYRHLCIFVSDAPSPLLCPGTSLLPRPPCGCCHPHCQGVRNLPPRWPSQGLLTAGLLSRGQLRVLLPVRSETAHLAHWWQKRWHLHGHLLAHGGQVEGGATSWLASQGTWYRGKSLLLSRMAEVGSLSSKAKLAMKIFVKRVFTIFATNASFLRVIANLQILLNIICNKDQ